MFAGLGRLIHRRRWISLFLCLVIAVVGGGWGLGVFARFQQGGFEDPKASSTYVSKLSATYFGSTNPDVLVLYRSDAMTVDQPDYMASVVTTVARLPKSKVAQAVTYWNNPEALGRLVSNDRHATFVALKLPNVDDITKTAYYNELKDSLQAPGLETRIAGGIPLGIEFGERTMSDIVNAERITILPLLVLLVMLFGALMASVLPIFVAIFSIAGGFAVLNAITYVTGVSSFALEVVTMMGVGLAIDYSLFIISRFREELQAGRDRETALSNTMATAGKTIVFSGVTVTTALGGLLLFPQMFLRSIGLGGMAVVLVSMFGASVLLPSLLAILGHRVEWGRMPWRRKKAASRRRDRGFWYALAHSVMRRPFPYFLATVAILGVLFVPFLHVQFGNVDARVLPKDSLTRGVVETVKRDFPGQSAEPIDVVVSGDLIPKDWTPGKDKIPPYMEQFRKRLQKLPNVTGAEYTGYTQEFGAVRISVTHKMDPMSKGAQDLVERIRGMTVTTEGPLYIDVGGSTAGQMDLMRSLTRTLPLMGLVVGVMTFILLFAAFGSVFLPLKAIVMNVLSIGASFGAIVWGFQEGHLAGLLDFTPTGGVEATSMILVLAVIFGLSMDYEVFLLSRIREEWDRTGDNRAAVAKGMQSTGGIITSAALLFLIVIAGFAMASITVVKLIGVGMFVAVVVDATLVRSLLVPATMRFMGAANWWLPGPLARLHRHMDLRESSEVPGAAEPDHDLDGRPAPSVRDDAFVPAASYAAAVGAVGAGAGAVTGAAVPVPPLNARLPSGQFAERFVAEPPPSAPAAAVHRSSRQQPIPPAPVPPPPVPQPVPPPPAPESPRRVRPQPADRTQRAPGRTVFDTSTTAFDTSTTATKPVRREMSEMGLLEGEPAAYAVRHSPGAVSDRAAGTRSDRPSAPRWEGPRPPVPTQDPSKRRRIVPDPDGAGWRWRTADDE